MIDDDICNRKIEFIANSEIMTRNRNCKKVEEKMLRVLKCKEIVASRCFFTKLDWYKSDFESLFSQIFRISKLLF